MYLSHFRPWGIIDHEEPLCPIGDIAPGCLWLDDNVRVWAGDITQIIMVWNTSHNNIENQDQRQISNTNCTKSQNFNFSRPAFCDCLCPVPWSQVLSREWRCSWRSADRRCSNYIWVISIWLPIKVRFILEVWLDLVISWSWWKKTSTSEVTLNAMGKFDHYQSTTTKSHQPCAYCGDTL